MLDNIKDNFKKFARRRLGKKPLGQTVYAGIMLLLFFIKCINFYIRPDIGSAVFPLACMTALFVGGVYFIVNIFSPKGANITLTSIYFFISIIMAVDLVYYSYAGKLPAVGLLSMTGQLGAVTASIEELISFKALFSLLDLPIWIVILAVRKPFRAYRRFPIPGFVGLVTGSAFIVFFGVSILICTLLGTFSAAYMPNEMLVYHGTDLGEILFPEEERDVDWIQYSSSPDKDNPYFGVAKDKNVFVIQVEALQSFLIGKEYMGQEITPVLNSLIENDSLYFENYYYQVGAGNTSDAEFAVNNSLYPQDDKASYNAYASNDYFGLPYLLKANGYSTATAFHGYYGDFWNRNNAYVTQGFDDYISYEDFIVRDDFDESQLRTMGISDRAMFNETLEIVKTYEEPFYSFIITLSSHHPFALPFSDRYIDADNMSPTLVNLYIQSVCYFDKVLGEFLDGLRKAGLYDNSVFVIYGDHYAIPQADKYDEQVESITGEVYDVRERFNVPLIFHIPGLGEAKTFDTVGSHVDVLPTLLCLTGIHNDKSVMFGHNLLNEDYEGIVYELTHMQKGSFITKDIIYAYTLGGINSKVFANEGFSTDPDNEEYLRLVEEAIKAMDDCTALLRSNKVVIN